MVHPPFSVIAKIRVFVFTGTLICVFIVVCNLAVIRVLCHLGCKDTRRHVAWRRISRTRSVSSGSSTTTTGVVNNSGDVTYYNNASTPEEIAFARLMAVLCIGFLICWMPQMVSDLHKSLGSSHLHCIFILPC